MIMNAGSCQSLLVMMMTWSLGDQWIFSRIGGGVKQLEAVVYGAVLKDSVQILENFPRLQIRYYLLQTKHELSCSWLYFVLLFYLVVGGGAVGFVPAYFWHFEKLVEYKSIGLLTSPSIGQ